MTSDEKTAILVVQKFRTNDGVDITEDFEQHVNFANLDNDKVYAYPRNHTIWPLNQQSERAQQESLTAPGYPIPSLRCFADAAEFAATSKFVGYQVIHGKFGDRGFHAWIDYPNKIIESNWVSGVLYHVVWPKKQRVTMGMSGEPLKRMKRYSRKQLLTLVEKTQSCGPWERFMLEDIKDEDAEIQRLKADHDEMFAKMRAHQRSVRNAV